MLCSRTKLLWNLGDLFFPYLPMASEYRISTGSLICDRVSLWNRIRIHRSLHVTDIIGKSSSIIYFVFQEWSNPLSSLCDASLPLAKDFFKKCRQGTLLSWHDRTIWLNRKWAHLILGDRKDVTGMRSPYWRHWCFPAPQPAGGVQDERHGRPQPLQPRMPFHSDSASIKPIDSPRGDRAWWYGINVPQESSVEKPREAVKTLQRSGWTRVLSLPSVAGMKRLSCLGCDDDGHNLSKWS